VTHPALLLPLVATLSSIRDLHCRLPLLLPAPSAPQTLVPSGLNIADRHIQACDSTLAISAYRPFTQYRQRCCRSQHPVHQLACICLWDACTQEARVRATKRIRENARPVHDEGECVTEAGGASAQSSWSWGCFIAA